MVRDLFELLLRLCVLVQQLGVPSFHRNHVRKYVIQSLIYEVVGAGGEQRLHGLVLLINLPINYIISLYILYVTHKSANVSHASCGGRKCHTFLDFTRCTGTELRKVPD